MEESDTSREQFPFDLPERPQARSIRKVDARIVEECTVFDEVGTLVHAYSS